MFDHPRDLFVLRLAVFLRSTLTHSPSDFSLEALQTQISRGQLLQELPICEILEPLVRRVRGAHSLSLEDRGDDDEQSWYYNKQAHKPCNNEELKHCATKTKP